MGSRIPPGDAAESDDAKERARMALRAWLARRFRAHRMADRTAKDTQDDDVFAMRRLAHSRKIRLMQIEQGYARLRSLTRTSVGGCHAPCDPQGSQGRPAEP